MRRTKEEAAQTRALVLKKALEVFSEKGYAAATLSDIAKAAEVTRGAIYWHFDSKADLYNTLVREYGARGTAIMQAAVEEGGTLPDILRRVFIRQLEAVEEDPELRALMELYLFKTGPAPELEEGHRQQVESGLGLIAMLAGIMGQGMGAGLLRDDLDPRDMARTYLAAQNGLIQLWLTAPQAFSLKESAAAFAEVVMTGITAG